MSSTFGHLFRCTTFGESHGGAVGVVVDGCPSGHKINLDLIQKQLDRRRPGQSHLTSPRAELDQVECLSGLVDGITLGSPICLIVRNKDFRKEDYEDLKVTYRPSHADYTTDAKYGVSAPSGGGRASARETIGRVAAAGIAEQILQSKLSGFSATAWVDSVKGIASSVNDLSSITRDKVDSNALRCPDESAAKEMEAEILAAKKAGDSVGGTILCAVNGCPPGLGEPIFDKLEAELARAIMSLPACKGFEVGSGFGSTRLKGSEHNDAFVMKEGKVSTATNNSGGIQGGISNGELIYFRAAFKPVSTIFKDQKSVTRDGDEVTMKPKAGRHDPCVLPRAVPMVEAMATLTIMDHYLRQEALKAGQF